MVGFALPMCCSRDSIGFYSWEINMYNARAGVILLYSTIFYDTKLLVFWCLGRGMPNHPIDCYCNGQVAPKGAGPTSRSLIFQGRGFSLTSNFLLLKL